MTQVTEAMISAYRNKFREIWPGSHPDKKTTVELLNAALASLSHTMGVKVRELEWTEPAEANQECRYNHVKAQGLEEYRIEWKGWKDFDAPVVYHGDDFVAAANDLDDAKVVAKADYQKRVDKVLSHLIPSALTPTQQPEPVFWGEPDPNEAINAANEINSLTGGELRQTFWWEQKAKAMAAYIASPQAVPGWEKERERSNNLGLEKS